MNAKYLFFVAIFAVWMGVFFPVFGSAPPPAKIKQIDEKFLDTPAGVKAIKTEKGDLVQYSSFFSALEKGEILKNLKVELFGDSVVSKCVVEAPVFRRDVTSPLNVRLDPHQKKLSCMLSAVKPGQTIVKITPIGEDGKARKTREFTVDVFDPWSGDGIGHVGLLYKLGDKTASSVSRPVEGQGARVGDLIQHVTIFPTDIKEKSIKSIKVEISGDAVTLLAVVEVPVTNDIEGDSKFGELDKSHNSFSCFLIAAKIGEAKVSIIPIGEDGKERPARQLNIKVFKSKEK